MIEVPKTGFARIVGATGRVSEWVPVSDIHDDGTAVFVAKPSATVAAAKFSWVSLSHIEYVTAEEKQKMEEARASRQKEGGKS